MGKYLVSVELACEQALQVDAREVGERRRKSEGPSRLALLAQIGEPARRLVLNSKCFLSRV